jgi:hypothetical protein
MSFGTAGPPATTKQVQYLLSLVQKAGYADFRDARHPLGLTQRQAGGRFTRTEASELIDRLVGEGHGGGAPAVAATPVGPGQMVFGARRSGAEIAAEERLALERDRIVRGLPADLLAAELERRGWQVEAPS